MYTISITGDQSKYRALARRQRRDDAFVTDHDTTNDEGEKITEYKLPGPDGTTTTVTRNYTKLYKDEISMTGNVDLLVIEAELLAEGRTLSNPHIPLSDAVAEAARSRIDAAGNNPAWEVVFDGE